MQSSSTTTIFDKIEPKGNVETLVQRLAFTRYNVHIEGEKEEVKQAIKSATECIATINYPDRKDLPYLPTLCKQVGIYYLFYLRDEKNAVLYLEKFRSMSSGGTEDRADANLWLGYAKTITGTYRDPKEITAALFSYQALSQSKRSSELEVALKRAIGRCFLGLIYHRRAMYTDDVAEKKEAAGLALEQLDSAQTTQELYLKEFPLLKIELANTLRIKGACLEQKQSQEGLECLMQSSAYSQAFCDETRHEHFMRFATLQTRAACLINSPSSGKAQYEEACHLLEDAYHGQKSLFDTLQHPDIAETLHFHGEALEKLDALPLARVLFESSLKIKETFLPLGNPIRVKTEQAIARVSEKLAPAAAAQHQSEQAPGTPAYRS